MGWGPANSSCYLEPDISNYLDTPLLGSSKTDHINKANAEEAPFIELAFSATAEISVTNASGESIGYADSAIFNDFSDGLPIVPKIGRAAPPVGFLLPEDQYNIEMTGLSDSLVSLTQISDTIVYDYTRRDGLSHQTDRLSVDSTFSVINPDSSGKVTMLTATSIDDDSERAFSVSGMNMTSDDIIGIQIPDKTNLRLTNYGSSKQYTLILRRSSTDGTVHFRHGSISLSSNSVHHIEPVWESVETEPVQILIDVGADGTVDDTVTVENETTGTVEDQNRQTSNDATPTRFALAQNYPNPFNPETTFKFAIPQDGYVMLKIYDLLGNEVATVLSESLSSGEHTVAWSAESVAAGVYLYRLQSGSYSQTRKLVLLK